MKGQTLQDPFLNALRKDRIPVAIFLVNGIKLQGQIESFDQYVVVLKNTVSQMVYKHAISTIVPVRNPRTDSLLDRTDRPVDRHTTNRPTEHGDRGERIIGEFDRKSFEVRGFDGQTPIELLTKPMQLADIEGANFGSGRFGASDVDNARLDAGESGWTAENAQNLAWRSADKLTVNENDSVKDEVGDKAEKAATFGYSKGSLFDTQ